MDSANVSAVLFVKDLDRVAAFYAGALEMTRVTGDSDHSVLECRGFRFIVHQIPKHIADRITIESPPHRRVEGTIRLNFPIQNIHDTRRVARSMGGDLDDAPPPWATPDSNVFLGHDPEGNVFAVSQYDR